MKKITGTIYAYPLLVLCFIGWFPVARAQNLVPNPSFEEYDSIPCVYFSKEEFNNLVMDWYSPVNSSPDIYSYLSVQEDGSPCLTHPQSDRSVGILTQEPRDGIAMAGLVHLYNVQLAYYSREYMQVKLKQPLEPHSNYYYGFYVNLADAALISANKLGLLFSETPKISDTSAFLPAQPQVIVEQPITNKEDWHLINGIYTPMRYEEYLTIGNFSLYEDINIVPVDSTYSNWAFAFSDVVYYLIDSVFVEPINELEIPNVFTPNGDEYNQHFTITNLQEDRWILTVVNRWGQQVYYSRYYHNEWDGAGLPPGVYYYHLKHRYVDMEYKGEVTIIE